MEKIAQTFLNFIAPIQDYIYIFLAITFITCALVLIFGSKNDKLENAKKYLIAGLAGSVLIAVAIPLAKEFAAKIVF